MNRRRYLAVMVSTISLSGCTGGPGDPITILAINQHESLHSVTAWVVHKTKLAVANTVEVATKDHATLGEMAWKSGRYRVTVQVDDEGVLAKEFQSEEWFNQLDVFIDAGERISIRRVVQPT